MLDADLVSACVCVCARVLKVVNEPISTLSPFSIPATYIQLPGL